MELAEKLSSSIQRAGGSDGILGLAWPALNAVKPTQQLTPVENMIKQNLISSVSIQVRELTVNICYLCTISLSSRLSSTEAITGFTLSELLRLPRRVYRSPSKYSANTAIHVTNLLFVS